MSDPSHPYFQIHQFRTIINGQEIVYYSKPGLPDWQTITPAEVLLAENVQLPMDGRASLYGCRHGALAVALAHRYPGCELSMTDISSIALDMTARTLRFNEIKNTRTFSPLTSPGFPPQPQDVVLIHLPKGRKLAQRWLLEARMALRPGGDLYLAGPNEEGVQPVIKDATSLFGNVRILAYKKGNRIAHLQKTTSAPPPPTWSQEPGILPETWLEFAVQTPFGDFHLRSLPGVFSSGRLDEGTGLMLSALRSTLADLAGLRILDLGCGYGIIGLSAAMHGAGGVDMVDDNLLAVAAVRENILSYHLSNAHAFPGDGTGSLQTQVYDLVLTNPPFHAGKQVDYDAASAFISGARQVLAPGGKLILVANRFIRYNQLMRLEFGQVSTVIQNDKYHVLLSIKAA